MDSNQPFQKLTLEDLHRFLPDDLRDEVPSTPKSLPPAVDAGEKMPAQYAEYCLRVIAAYCRMMQDALELYIPLPKAELFHSSPCRIRLASGSNQSNKTFCSGVEYARFMRGMDPYQKLPKNNLSTMVVGKSQDHIGQVIWKKLYFPGAFEVIPDEDTGFYRSVRPDPNNPKYLDPIDLARRDEWRPAPPFMPPSCFAPGGIAYEKKAEGVPAQITTITGSNGIFCTSNGAPRNGIQLHYAWFDEELIKRAGRSWYSETMPRLVRFGGKFVWSYTPQESAPEAFELHRRFLRGDAGVQEFNFQIEDNPYFAPEDKAALYADYVAMGPEELAVRWYGNYAIHGRTVYPQYDLGEQGVEPFEIPDNWMRVAAIDPGTTCAAALFGAIPPEGNRLYVYAELMVKNKDATEFAKEVKRIVAGHRFEAFVIDKKGGAQTSMGRTDRVCDHYSKAFRDVGVTPSRLSGLDFVFGSSVCEARELSVKAMLNNRSLKFFRGRTNQLDRQLKNRYYDKNNRKRRESRTEHDLCDTIEYLVAFFDETGLYYKTPLPRKSISTADERSYKAFLKSNKPTHRRREWVTQS